MPKLANNGGIIHHWSRFHHISRQIVKSKVRYCVVGDEAIGFWPSVNPPQSSSEKWT
jgi:hypothetical protein